MGPRVSRVRFGSRGRWKPSSALTPLPLLRQGPRGLQGPPGPPGKLGRRVSAVGFDFSPPQNVLPCCHAQPKVPPTAPRPRGHGAFRPFLTPSPPHAGSRWSRWCQGSPGGHRTQGARGARTPASPLLRGTGTWAHPAPCAPQGDRGFDGLPGLPGEKGHRVSAAAPRPLRLPPVPLSPHLLCPVG